MITLFTQAETARIILSISCILFAGFLCTRITKKLHFPNVSGYIISGVLIGPYVLHLIPDEISANMDFITDIALAFIAFGVGKYFRLDTLKKNGGQVLIITICEALMAGFLITLSMVYIFHLSWSFSLLLGAIGCATAPASTIMTIRQYHAKGPFVDMILQVTALDDAVALLAFSACTAVVEAMAARSVMDIHVVVMPIVYNLLSLLSACVLAYVLHRIISAKRSSDHKLVLAVAIILLLTGVCSALDISPLLSCMVLGAVYINLSGNKDLFRQINSFTPPITLMFFVLSGMRLNVPALLSAGIIGVVYFFVRIIGKAIGAYGGAKIAHASQPIQKYLELALIPQAGVSIGLAVLGQRLLPASEGAMLSMIILSSAVLYEMIGPACAKLALKLAGAIPAQVPLPSIEDENKENIHQKEYSYIPHKKRQA